MDEVLTRIAAIHQQHALKCYLAIKSLKRQYDWPANDWLKVERLIELEEPTFNVAMLQSGSMPFKPIERRRHWILAHAIYPYAYFTMQDWFNQSDASEIFAYYFEQCTEKNEYLSHNISVLIAFKQAWSLIKTEKQKLRFIERFCEFVTATFYGNNHQSYPVTGDYAKPDNIDVKIVFSSALKHPGFWGHNLIALASIMRSKGEMPETMFIQLLTNLHEQCYWKFEDDTDKPKISCSGANDVSKQTLESACFELLINSQRNLHQITLAESTCYLFNLQWVSPKQRSRLIDVIIHFSKSKTI
ncbi:hypothetical protein [Shewanella pealeana]|uniref:Uncharacterized protein n=1 Tax=Shewanella pealeana (strain ATCC 700345 / ANG-SQ1) TaxID=398579 RepID=A8H251_SHEPA|nr:hypothetical protein [Shewanella pealeana]ABV86638.1 hypothetical protein Spea_1311 [Shewanella pealeana ATCC 700345]